MKSKIHELIKANYFSVSKKILLTVLVMAGISATAQVKVGTNPTTINADALFEMESTNKGMLLPRVALTSAISPAPLSAFVPGMVVYNTSNAGTAPDNVAFNTFYVSGTTSWIRLNLSTGDRGDLTIFGDSSNPLFLINNGSISSIKLDSSIKIGGGTTSSASVALEVAGGSKGFVVSTVSNLSDIITPVPGMLVYSTTENCLRLFTTLGWSNCISTVAGNVSTNGSAVVSSYSAPGGRTVNQTYGQAPNPISTSTNANVTTIGSYNIVLTNVTLPNYRFSATGAFTATGLNNIVLRGSGTIPGGLSGTFVFTSNTTPAFNVSLTIGTMTYSSGLGNTFTSFFNGQVNDIYTGTVTTTSHSTGEVFSAFDSCGDKQISITNPTSCTGSVTGTSGTVYPLVWINGQCWFSRNLNEVPLLKPSLPNTGTNIWIANGTTVINDEAYWGYGNTAVQNGTAGWATIEPGTDGILYQNSAAMNGERTERAKGMCPTNFHIPSDCEWSFLEHGLGMKIFENNITASALVFRDNDATGSNVGSKLRGEGTGFNNASGFNMLFAGARSTLGVFVNLNSSSRVASSTLLDVNSLNGLRIFPASNGGVGRSQIATATAVSVRCLRDN